MPHRGSGSSPTPPVWCGTPTLPPEQRSARRPRAGRCTPGCGRSTCPRSRWPGLWHAATLLREHRGDGHNAALVAHGIGGTEAHVLVALSLGMKAEEFSRTQHLPRAQLAAVIDGLRRRGLVDAAGSFTDAGRAIRERIEALTDELAAPAYDALTPDELGELVAGLEPIAAAV